MMMVHVAENLLNWGQSPALGAEVDAGTLNCIREQRESQKLSVPEYYERLECFVVSVESSSPLYPSDISLDIYS